MRWDRYNFSVQYSVVFTIIFALAVLIMPLFSTVFYFCNIDNVEKKIFKERYGTLYEGLQLDMEKDKRKSALIYPFLFIFRRLVFVATIVFTINFTWLQVSMQFASSVAMLMYFVLVYPFESVKLTRIEIFNEIIAVFMCYFMMCFTDWVPYA